jgi:hypothetical protein
LFLPVDLQSSDKALPCFCKGKRSRGIPIKAAEAAEAAALFIFILTFAFLPLLLPNQGQKGTSSPRTKLCHDSSFAFTIAKQRQKAKQRQQIKRSCGAEQRVGRLEFKFRLALAKGKLQPRENINNDCGAMD